MSDFKLQFQQKCTEFDELNLQFAEYQGTHDANQSKATSSSATSKKK